MKLFVSYSRDDAVWVNNLVSELRGNGFHSVWLDTSMLIGGQDWWLGILAGIEDAECMIAILTPKSAASIYCTAEWNYAYALNMPILPLILKPDNLIYPDLIAKTHTHATDVSNVSIDRALWICERSFSYFDKHQPLFQRPVPPPERPPVPELLKRHSSPDQVIEIFAQAEKHWDAGHLDDAEKLFLQVIDANLPVSGPAASERMSLLRYQRQRLLNYHSIASLMEDPVLRDGSILLWKSYLSNYGADYDPNHYAQYFAALPPDPAPPARPKPAVATLKQSDAPTRPVNPVGESETQYLLNVVRNWQRYNPYERAEAGRRLAEIGDPRPGVGLRPDGLPDILWCEVPGGKVKLGGDKDAQTTRRTQEITLPTFYIAKYPVTKAQFRAFLTASDGYTSEDWWHGQLPPMPKGQQFHYANHPRDSVNWYDALAWCRWLSRKLGYAITLPTDQQWEKAARGSDGRCYPWGNDYIAGYANINETHLDHKIGKYYLRTTTAVGIYPQADSPYGVSDLCGNIWEWLLTEFDNPDCHDMLNHVPRTLRGGSWESVHGFSRATFRYGHFATSREPNFGFRVVTTTRPPSLDR